MKVGTKSLLFGAHQVFLHPWFVFAAWWKLYGFPYDPRLWIVFVIHDWGYWGKPNMDGEEGDTHPEWAADIMRRLFGHEWYLLCLLHSRFYAKKMGRNPSRLCAADKLACCFEPWWLYIPRAWATGEIHEYMSAATARHEGGEGKYYTMNLSIGSYREWFESVKSYLNDWVEEHKEGKEDNWTPLMKED